MRWVPWTRGHGAARRKRRGRGHPLLGHRATGVLVLMLSFLLLGGCTLGASGQLAGSLTLGLAAKAEPRLPGCTHAAPVALGMSAMQRLYVGSGWRTYLLHVPTTYSRATPQPLVLIFHGHGSNPTHFEQSTRFSALADQRDFIAVYPQGAVGKDGQTGWDTHRGRDPATNDIAFVAALLAHLRGQLCIDPERVYAAGFSNGGGMVAELACALPGQFAAVAVVSGDFYPQPGACSLSRPLPILEIHGTADTVNPYDGSSGLHYMSVPEWVTGWVARDGCTGEAVAATAGLVESLDWRACRQGAEVLHVRLIGGKHVWPGGTVPAGAPAADQQYGATNAIWAFCSAHTLPETTSA